MIHAIDFSRATSSEYISLKSKISSISRIGVLVNNVGVGHTMPVAFQECSDSEMDGVLEINCRATMKITKMIVPGMIEACVINFLYPHLRGIKGKK